MPRWALWGRRGSQEATIWAFSGVQKIAGWEKLKTLVLDSVSSPIIKGVYNIALDEFLNWFRKAPRSGFSKATVSA
ncbi:MAG TPA: hypothetical protein VLN48_05540 [Bryobacteraceae bacterium]|nr:hypothetical protein [Bryobacteraceae bacterium]